MTLLDKTPVPIPAGVSEQLAKIGYVNYAKRLSDDPRWNTLFKSAQEEEIKPEDVIESLFRAGLSRAFHNKAYPFWAVADVINRAEAESDATLKIAYLKEQYTLLERIHKDYSRNPNSPRELLDRLQKAPLLLKTTYPEVFQMPG